MRFELTTLTLARLCSTPELRPHRLDERGCIKSDGGLQEGKCTSKISVSGIRNPRKSAGKTRHQALVRPQRQAMLQRSKLGVKFAQSM